MNAPNLPALPGVQVGPQLADQPGPGFTGAGARRDIWHSAYGAMLIEVRDGAAFVNGARVASMAELRAAGD